MIKLRFWIIIASVLLLLGIIGSIITFPSLSVPEQSQEEKIITSDDIKTINIKTSNSNIEILPTVEDDIKIHLNHKSTEEKLTTIIQDATLFINVKSKYWEFININFFNNKSSLVIYLPEQQYESLQMKSSNGKIMLEDIVVDEINGKTNNGKVISNNIVANSINVKSNNGKVILNNIEATTTKFKTDNGKVELDSIQGDISGETSNGKINLVTDADFTNHTLDLRTDVGKIRVFEQSDWDSVIGNGEVLIKLHTNNGAITISEKE